MEGPVATRRGIVGAEGYAMKTTVSRLLLAFIAAGFGVEHAVANDPAELAAHVLEKAGTRAGVCVVIGCDDSGIALAIAQSSSFIVHLLDSGTSDLVSAREAAEAKHLFLPQFVVEQSTLERLPHADNVVDLLVTLNPSEGILSQLALPEILRVLRPEGTAIVGFTDAAETSRSALKRWVERGDPPVANVEKDKLGVWAEISKPPLAGVDDWSHWEHSPDNNPVSTDTVIKAPYMTQWMGEPYYITMPAITTAAGGRTFLAMGHIAHHEREEPWLNTLMARNGYNGAELWRRRLPDGYLVHRSAFIATDDVFYMIDLDGNGCLLLDPETGAEQREILIPDLSGEWKWMALKDDTLFILAGGERDPAETTIVRSQRSHWSWGELSQGYYAPRIPWGFGTTIAAYDLSRDRLLWSHTEDAPIDSRAMVLGDDGVFFYSPDAHLGRLDARTGENVWLNDDARTRALIEEPGVGLSSTPGFRTTVFSLYTRQALVYAAQTRMNVVAVSPEDGKLLWHRPKTSSNPNSLYVPSVLVSSGPSEAGRLLVGIGPDGSTLVVDPLSGDILEDLDFAKRSCARLTATPDSFFCRGMPEGTTRYDRISGKVSYNGALRPACNDGVIATNGLLYIGPWTCDCNLTLMGTVAMCSASQYDALAAGRFEPGAGDIAGVASLDVSPHDWPTYRGGNSHSSSTGARVSSELWKTWTYRPEHVYNPTAPTSAGGYIFLAGGDGKVRALDAQTGTLEWSLQTGGPIMQPPTIWNGRAYVGSGDGYIYALEATTGRLLWRFRAAPVERRIMVHGALCSTWPVNSGVLIEEGVAYAAAGIVDYDGTYVYALDAVTGALKWANTTSGHLNPELRKGVSAQGGLTIAGGRLWMAGGNVVSPASYDLVTGEYLGPGPGDGSPQANRGEEIGVFQDEYLVFGGRLRYSARENVVNPGTFNISGLESERDVEKLQTLCVGRIPPAWNQDYVLAVDGRFTPPRYYRTADVADAARKGHPYRASSSVIIDGIPPDSDVVALALADGAALAAYKAVQPGVLAPSWRVCSIDLTAATVTWQQDLPTGALAGGLLIDRESRAVVMLQDGSVVCYGGDQTLRAHIDALTATAQQNPARREQAVSALVGLLGSMQGPDGRGLVMAALAKAGVDVGRQARESGCITRWYLLGPVPWDEHNNPVDKVLVGEPDVDVAKPVRLGDRTLAWREYVTELANGEVDLARIYGSREYEAIYAYAQVDLSENADQDLFLKIGTNDGYKCWFNGMEAGRFDAGRAYRPDQDSLKVRAKAGINTVLLKVTQMGGKWGLGARITDAKGTPINLAEAMP